MDDDPEKYSTNVGLYPAVNHQGIFFVVGATAECNSLLHLLQNY
jgi:hypothetical protein